jgi:hypothetical protein
LITFCVVGSFEEFAVVEFRPGADEGDEVWWGAGKNAVTRSKRGLVSGMDPDDDDSAWDVCRWMSMS